MDQASRLGRQETLWSSGTGTNVSALRCTLLAFRQEVHAGEQRPLTSVIQTPVGTKAKGSISQVHATGAQRTENQYMLE